MKDKIFDKRIIALYVLVISSLVLGITYALSVVTSNVSLSSTTGQYGIDETVYGETKFSSDTLNLTPILDNDITTKTNNVIKIDFNVRGSSNNPTDKNIIYDIALNDLDVDCQLLSKDVKWKLVKNNTELSSGSLANSFDTIVDGRMVLTTIQEDLPSSSSTPDSYSFYLWISDACQKSDISQCTTEDEKRDQSYLLQKAISGKVEVELNTGEKKNLARTTSTDLDPDTCSNNQYRVVFDANGGTVSPQFVNKSSDLTTTTLPTPVRSNYTFDGWYIDEDLTTEVSNSDLQNTTTNTVLYAKWIPISKTLTLINNCTYPSNGNRTLTINYNSTYSELVPDLCLGNKFNGWFTAASGGSQINKNDRVKLTEDTSYYGQWSLNSYTLTYNLNGGTVSTANPSSYNIDTTTFNLNNPTKTGYTFTGWTEAIQSNIWYDGFIKNATQTDNSSVGIVHDNATYPKSVFSDLIYLKANNTYTLTPDTLGSVRWRVFKNVDGVLKYYGNGSSTKTYTPTEDCYVSIMFHLGENATNRNAAKVTSSDKPTTLTIPKGSTGNRVYTANFSNNTYTVSYTLNGGTAGTNAPTSGTYDTDVQISNPTKTVTLTGNENSTSGANGTGVKIGSATSKAQTFTGWTSSSSAGLGSNAKTGTASNPTTSWTGSSTKNTFFKNLRDTSGTVTLTANWTAVAFNLPTVTKDGYTCGWNTSSSGTTIQYASGSSYTPSANSADSINMYAVCLENQATVTINKNGSAWSSSGMNVALYSGTTVAYAYSEGTASGSTVSWSGVKAGTYNVYAGKRSDSETTLVDTGVDITVSNGTTSAGSGSATINYYVLTLNEGTGISSVTGAATYLSNQSASIGATATTGYAFSSWTVNSGNTPASTTTASTTVTITQATTLTANAKSKPYTITINSGTGGSVTVEDTTKSTNATASSGSSTTLSVSYGDTIKVTATASTGYTLSTLKHGSTSMSSGGTFTVSGDETVAATWTANTYTISYTLNGGTAGTNAPTTANWDQIIQIDNPTRTGYTFDGWTASNLNVNTAYYGDTDTTVTTLWSDADTKVKATYFKNLTATNGDTVNLTANWIANNYSITLYNLSGDRWTSTTCSGEGLEFTSSYMPTCKKTVTYGSTYGTLPTPTRSGYEFNGWYTSYSGGTKITSDSIVSITSNQTLYSQWSSGTYKVIFDQTDGDEWTDTTCSGTGITFNSSTSTCEKSVTYGYSSTYGTLPTPTRTGYTFDGWYTKTSGGTKVTSSSRVSITADQTLYAHWSAQTYTITYDANGGSGAPNSQTKDYGVDLTLSTTIPTYSGYTFLGWSTSNTATSATYNAGGTYSVNESATLYAVWEKNRDINITNINIDGDSSNSLPTSGIYTMSYNCEKGSTLSWNTYSKTITYGSGAVVGDTCSVSFTSSTNYPLLNTMEVGSYVAYTGSGGKVGSTSVTCKINGSASTSTGDTEAPNSCLGQNAREDLDTSGYTKGWCGPSKYKYYTIGWRIAYISNNKAIIISAGAPECYKETSDSIAENIKIFNSKALKYCNTNYVDGNCTCTDSDKDGLCDSPSTDAWAINDTDFYYITKAISGVGKRIADGSSSLGDVGGYLGNTLYCYDKRSNKECGYNNDLLDNGSIYWFAAQYSSTSSNSLWWSPNGRSVIGGASPVTTTGGIRPLISLSSTVYVTGGSGTMDDPYTIGN